MTSSVQRIGALIRRMPFADRLIARLPDTARFVLDELRTAEAASTGDVHRGDVGPGQTVRGASFVLGRVREGGAVRAVNVLRGDVDGGAVCAAHVLFGDVRHGEVRGVNVLIGDVRGGQVEDVHIVVGDVLGGTLSGCLAVIGDVHDGEGHVQRVVGRVLGGRFTVGERVEP
jgi:hypothetical protein